MRTLRQPDKRLKAIQTLKMKFCSTAGLSKAKRVKLEEQIKNTNIIGSGRRNLTRKTKLNISETES